MEVFVKILEIINNKISLPVAITSVLLLFLPENLIDKMGLRSFLSSNKGFIWIIFLFSSTIYLYEKTKNLINFVRFKQSQARAIDNLDGLSGDEEDWIYFCLKENTRTLNATAINATAMSLVSKGIVYPPSTSDKLDTPFTINEAVWKYLKKNKNRYCSETKLKDTQYNRSVNRFVDDLTSPV